MVEQMLVSALFASLLGSSEAITRKHHALKAPSSEDVDLRHSLYFTQTVDHFNRADGRTFQQRYFVNTTFWNGANTNAPVFLCVGGEGPPLDFQVS